MAVLDILVYPDMRLRRKGNPVVLFDNELADLVSSMAETMYASNGIGLAAVQLGISKRVFVIDVSKDRNDLKVFINPKIMHLEGKIQSEEGCLSVPGIIETVERMNTVTIQASDLKGKEFSVSEQGLLAICIQHEMDHLDGKIFIDYLPQIKRHREKKINKHY